MRKTPVQKLIDRLEKRILDEEKSHDKFQAYKAVKAMATELLEEEKQMVMQSYSDGIGNGMSQPDELKYFTETYER